MSVNPKTPAPGNPKKTPGRAYFTHWRNGKRYYARDYGYGCWPFGGSGKNPPKVK